MNSLNNIIDDILLEARNSNIAESEKLSKLQIEQWINNYRVYLIKQELDRKDVNEIDPEYIQTISDIHLSEVSNEYGKICYVGDRELPTLINFKNKPGVVTVKDKVGNIIQVGHETKQRYQKYRKYTCGDYIAYVKGNKIYVESQTNLLEYVDVDVIAQDPTSLSECFDPNGPYPIPARMIPTIKDLIFSKELSIMRNAISDTTNNSEDDTQNKPLSRRYR